MGQQAADKKTPLEDGPTPGTKLVDAALATSAAPTYFPPHDCPGFGYCVDGGLVANCPASIALGLWLRANPKTFDDVRILSIGTGNQSSAIDIKDKESSPFTDPGYFGPGAWLYPVSRGPGVKDEKLTPAFPLISALLDASSSSHNYICKQAMGDNYCRVQVNLPKPIDLDDTSPGSLKALETAALIPRFSGRSSRTGFRHPSSSRWNVAANRDRPSVPVESESIPLPIRGRLETRTVSLEEDDHGDRDRSRNPTIAGSGGADLA